MKLSFNWKLTLLFVFISIGAIALGFISYRTHKLFSETSQLIEHTQQVILKAEQVLSIVKDFGSSSRGFAITADSVFLENFQNAKDSVEVSIAHLKEITNENPLQQIRIDSLLPLVNRRMEFSEKVILLTAQNKRDEAYDLVASREGFKLMQQIRDLINKIQNEENQLLAQRKKAYAEKELASDRSYYLLILNMLGVLLFTFLIIQRDYRFRRKAAEESHNKSELYSQTLVSLGDGVIATDAHGIITFLNRAASELLGWKQDEAIGNHITHVFKITNESTGLIVNNPVMDAIQKNEIVLLANHTILEKKNGEILYIDDSGAPIHDLKGKVIGGVLVFRDISSRKKAENELKANEAKFKAYFENSMAGILMTRPDGRILNANPSACAILGMSEEEIIQLGREGIVDITDPKLALFFEERSRTGKARGEQTMIRKGGSRFPVEVSSAVFNHIDGEIRTCLIFEDITDRKKSEELIRQMNRGLELRIQEKTKEVIEKEERYRYALNHMMEGVQIIDFNWRYLYLNDEAIKQSNYTANELVGHTMMEMYPGFEKAPLFSILERCMKERSSTHLDNEFIYPDQTSRWYELSIQPVPEGLFILSTDITKRKQAEQKLHDHNAELKKTNAELDRFVYSVSHDLRAPLTSLLGLIEITDKDISSTSKNQKDRLAMMRKSVNKLDSFISDILDYSRNARTSIANEKIHFEEVLTEMHDNMANAAGCKLSFRIEQPIDFYSDKRRINMILNNLISNSVKYRDHQKENSFVNILVQVNKKEAIIEVEDNGIGIAHADRERIFEMFERVSTQATGSGIGLYIVKEIVEKLKGSIILDSELNKGSKFVVKLPNLNIFV